MNDFNLSCDLDSDNNLCLEICNLFLLWNMSFYDDIIMSTLSINFRE